MTGGAFRRVVEAFFRRWPLYILLLVAALFLGYRTVSNASVDYTASGAIFVDSETLVSAQSGVEVPGYYGYQSPAETTRQELNGLINTDVFMESVLERAEVDLPSDPLSRSNELSRLRRDVSTAVFSNSLLQVSVTTAEPELSSQITLAIIEEFIQLQISVNIAESGASEDFFNELVVGYQQDLIEARREVDNALRGVEGSLEDLSAEDLVEVQRLQEAEVIAAARFREAVQDVEASRLAMLQTETDVRQRLSTFDPPEIPSEPNGSFFEDVQVLVMFAMVGLALALLGPILSAVLGRGVLFADDLDAIPDVQVIGVVPRVRRGMLKLDDVEVTAQSADTSFGPVLQRQSAPVQQAPLTNVSQPPTMTNGAAAAPAANPAWSAPAATTPTVAAQPAPTQPVTAQPAAAQPAVAQPVAAQPVVAQPGTAGTATPAAAESQPLAALPLWARPADATSELPLSSKVSPDTTPPGAKPTGAAPNGSPATGNHNAVTPGAAVPGTAVAGTEAKSATPKSAGGPAGFENGDLAADFDDLDDEDELSGNVVKVDPTRRTHA